MPRASAVKKYKKRVESDFWHAANKAFTAKERRAYNAWLGDVRIALSNLEEVTWSFEVSWQQPMREERLHKLAKLLEECPFMVRS